MSPISRLKSQNIVSLNANSQKNTKFSKKIFRGVISDVISQLSPNYSFYSSKINLPYCPWRPQSSGNIERQHCTLKNALFMLCEDRGCEWTDIMESVVSSMNATVCSATGVSPHYVISGRHPNVGLPRINDKDITANTPTA